MRNSTQGACAWRVVLTYSLSCMSTALGVPGVQWLELDAFTAWTIAIPGGGTKIL